MAKTLVLKGTDFANNRLAKISFGGEIPCTGLSLSQGTIAFTAVGGIVALIATKVPSDTTDELTWASSNDTVATVTDGVVTCVGLGSATITATCGSQAATCSVSVSISIDANTDLSPVNGYNTASTDLSANPQKDYLGVTSKSGGRVYASDNALDYKAISTGNEAFASLYAIPIPKNTKKIIFAYPNKFVRIRVALMDSTKTHDYNTGIVSAKVIYYTGAVSAVGEHTIDISEYSADSFVFNLESTSYNADTVTGDVTVTFSNV